MNLCRHVAIILISWACSSYCQSAGCDGAIECSTNSTYPTLATITPSTTYEYCDLSGYYVSRWLKLVIPAEGWVKIDVTAADQVGLVGLNLHLIE
jgi:hypothetical protein